MEKTTQDKQIQLQNIHPEHKKCSIFIKQETSETGRSCRSYKKQAGADLKLIGIGTKTQSSVIL